MALAVIALAASGCGSGSRPPSTTGQTTAPTTTVLTVFRVDGGLLRPSVVRVRRTAHPAEAALRALGVDAAVTVAGGTATVDLARALDPHVAEIVYTLTQFASVRRVDVAGRRGLTRADFASYVPPILVETPAPGAEVPATFHVSGTASVFEATLVVELVRDGRALVRKTVTASEGAPARGTFDTTLHASAGPATVRAFSPSAADGSPQHEVDVAVTVKP